MFGNTDNNLKAVQKSYEFIKFKWQGSDDIHNHFFFTWNVVFALFKIRVVLQDKFWNDLLGYYLW